MLTATGKTSVRPLANRPFDVYVRVTDEKGANMKLLARAADRLLQVVIPATEADACYPPDCFYQRCCYNCAGQLVCG